MIELSQELAEFEGRIRWTGHHIDRGVDRLDGLAEDEMVEEAQERRRVERTTPPVPTRLKGWGIL
jgi:hypothetical protein